MPPQATQFHETTIVVGVSGRTMPVTFGVVPARSLAAEQRQQIESVAGLVGVVGGEPDEAVALPNAWSLITAVALMLDPAFAPSLEREDERLAIWAALRSDAESGGEFERFAEPTWWSSPGAPRPTPPAVAESLLLSADIPFESSPLSGQSIASIIAASGGAGHVVAVVGAARSEWLLVAVPAGVVVMKVADGLGRGVGDGAHDVVRYRLLAWLAPESLALASGA